MSAPVAPPIRNTAKLDHQKSLHPMKQPNIGIEGDVSPGFEAVREAFAENFSRRHELGGACCVYHRGRKVVDLWGGVRNKSTGEPWQGGTMVLVYSATKGLAAMTLAVAHSRGWLDYEQRVCSYWLTERACSPWMSRWIGAWSPISIVSRSSWLGRNRLGSLAHGRPITRSA